MISSDIFNQVNDSNTDALRVIKDIFLISEEDDEYFSKIIFKVNDEFWIFSCNSNYDEICFDVSLHAPFELNEARKNLTELINFSIGNIWAIISEKNYTDGIHLLIYDPSIVNASKFIGLFTIIGIGGGLVYDINTKSIYDYLV